MTKVRKNTQMSLINIKGAGRPAINDKGIRHIARPFLKKPSSLHLTVKVKRIKAEMQNKKVLALLKRSIFNARRQGLKVIHFALEYDHVHLLIEAENNLVLRKGMQAFGVTMAKGINRLKRMNGSVYKHRYHFRQITSSTELKRVMNYLFKNGLKHRTAKSLVHSFNSIQAEMKFSLFSRTKIHLDQDLLSQLDKGKIFFRGLDYC